MDNQHKIRKIHPFNPQPDIIAEAAKLIKKGGLAAFPTRCLYGMGTDAFNADAVDRIFGIKQRSYQNPILVLISKKEDLDRIVQHVPPAALKIMDKFWPGKVTIVFEAKNSLPDVLTAGTGKIGVRLCGHPVASALVSAVKNPVTGTSANLAGNAGCSRISDMDSQLADRLDLILDAGILKGGAGSTVADVTTDIPVILREGVVPGKDIFAVLENK
ncbi:MAG: threonylcarbamoyl-AMP synthase [Desulfobacteraceae bacterium]|nr:threonylcarbamoyl-AMP synthase [Desulfobacteraceae bacterium]